MTKSEQQPDRDRANSQGLFFFSQRMKDFEEVIRDRDVRVSPERIAIEAFSFEDEMK
jgi:hypothetical protein